MSTLLLVGRIFMHSFTHSFIITVDQGLRVSRKGDTVTNMQTVHLFVETSECMRVQPRIPTAS